jgi:hypothetical protein
MASPIMSRAYSAGAQTVRQVSAQGQKAASRLYSSVAASVETSSAQGFMGTIRSMGSYLQNGVVKAYQAVSGWVTKAFKAVLGAFGG